MRAMQSSIAMSTLDRSGRSTTPILQFDHQSHRMRERLRTRNGMGTLIGISPEMEYVYGIMSKVAHSVHAVLILGESGTGKELVARAIHDMGPSSAKPFIPVDCGSLVATLIESELFGHVKGAFTGATCAKEGLLAAAHGGTVFLDEIGELPLDLQAKLLRALQEKEVRPVGANKATPFCARILAATNCDLDAMMVQGRFRKDLYFRLNVVSIMIPPLRDRRSDIKMLAEHLLEKINRELGEAHTLSEDVVELMTEYDWPGNVRELQHAVERACAISSGIILDLVDMPTALHDFRKHRARADLSSAAPGELHGESASSSVISIAKIERKAILKTIDQLKGDKLMAAKLLGIGKTTLYRKLKEYGIADREGPSLPVA